MGLEKSLDRSLGWDGGRKARVIDVREHSHRGDYGPSARKVDGDGKILVTWMPQEEAEDVEHVMAVIGQGEWMDDGVVVHDNDHERHGGDSNNESR